MNGFWTTDPASWNGSVRQIAGVRPRSHVVLTGTIRAAAGTTVGSSPAWRCTLADGTGEIELIFLGRAHLAGLDPGRYCGVTGTAVLAGPAGRRHLVIIDLGLPDLPGTGVISEIRADSTIPIVAISAQDPGLAEAAALAAGADVYLSKPFPIGRLVAAVRALLGSAAQAGPPTRA